MGRETVVALVKNPPDFVSRLGQKSTESMFTAVFQNTLFWQMKQCENGLKIFCEFV
jgi:hypothetical protein